MYCYLIFATEVFQALPIQDPKSQSSQQPSTEYSYFGKTKFLNHYRVILSTTI